MGKFCFACGKDTENSGMCDDCTLKNVKLMNKEMTVVECSQCHNVKISNGWREFDPPGYFKRKLRLDKVAVEKENSSGANTWFFIKSEKGDFRVKLHFNRLVCGPCGKRKSGFYAAVIQLRGAITQKSFEATLDLLDSGTHDLGFYDVEKVKGGYDFKIGSKSVAKNVVSGLRKKYHVTVVRSYKVITQRDGQDVKRDFICVRV